MVGEGPYEILPYAEIEQLKKQIEDLKKKSASSGEVLDAINRLTEVMESMLHLFESAASGMKKEGEGPLGKKLDKILEQNETIAESILSLSDTIKDIQSKGKEPYIVRQKTQPVVPPEPMPRVEPDFSMPPPGFERLMPRGPVPTQPTPRGPMHGPPLRQGPMSGPPPKPEVPMPPVPPGEKIPTPPPGPPPMEPMPGREGPIPMPTGSFKDLDLEKPKKGLFGRFKK